MQNEARSTNRHSAIDQLIAIDLLATPDIYSGTPLARPPTGRLSIGHVSGAVVVASHLHS